jgi:hypothetical protein
MQLAHFVPLHQVDSFVTVITTFVSLDLEADCPPDLYRANQCIARSGGLLTAKVRAVWMPKAHTTASAIADHGQHGAFPVHILARRSFVYMVS